MKHVLRLLAVLILLGAIGAAATIILSFPKNRIAIVGGDHTAEARLPEGTTVRVDMAPVFLTHLAEYERRLTVCGGGFASCRSRWLMTDTGGHRKINLYRQPDGSVVAVDTLWMMQLTGSPQIRIFTHAEEKAARLRSGKWNCRADGPVPPVTGEITPSRYFRDMDYLGTFEFFTDDNRPAGTVRLGTFRFVPAAVYGEQQCGYPSRG